ncbi:MAG: crotonase/enoyl-CoA hydratase family protein [Candidatus Krumholzibacteriia bacterium]
MVPSPEDFVVMDDRFISIRNDYRQVMVRYDRRFRALWYALSPRPRPCFNLGILAELRHLHRTIVDANRKAQARDLALPVRYTVLSSLSPGVFNLGGDLELFLRLITARDRRGLLDYATACIDVLYPNAVHFDLPMTTISLVKGEALGGGCEAAISSNIVVAERSARFGLPEILFNLIPGMGAYSFLIRRTTPDITDRLITTGEILTAEQMRDLGLVDILADDGQGERTVLDYLQRHERRHNAHLALNQVRRCVNPLTYEELIRITEIWVEAALQLQGRDLKMIRKLIAAQDRKAGAADGARKMAQEG